MSGSVGLCRKPAQYRGHCALVVVLGLTYACNPKAADRAPELGDAARTSPVGSALASGASSLSEPVPNAAPSASADAKLVGEPEKIDFQDVAMGTNVHFIAYTNPQADAAQIKTAITQALAEMRRLEGLMSEWRDDSEVGKINLNPEQWVPVGPETYSVISRALEEGKASGGAFDITFQAMSDIWKFGSAADAQPKVPTKAEIEKRRKLVDYRTVELDPAQHAVRIPKGHKIGLGGIAKGYIVDSAAAVLKRANIRDFLVQAGGDLFGSGKKPDGSPWVSGIQDPRGPQGAFFASIELSDHAFSTAGDYARSYVIGNRRYHHIIDPHTGYPATASRSVTVWAEDATTADAIDDAVFILGPEAGLKLVEASPGVGVVIVDKNNKVWVSPRLEGKVHLTRPPTDGI
ncbi:MAG TPA: FAD:protein FMN transferase [Polyangiaceae bacterium]|jgi:thiamine biosynthesis lipoprotein|nr:FAD:protein FMN transferase [Polyangiaceae bacterium]